jgi:hypothetical protein
VTGDWRDWRPAIWLTMLGIAVALLVNPWYLSALLFGAAIGAAFRIQQRRRRYRTQEGSSETRRRQKGDKR